MNKIIYIVGTALLFLLPVFQEIFGINIFTDFLFLIIYLFILSLLIPIILGNYLNSKTNQSYKKITLVFIGLNLSASAVYPLSLLSSITPGF
jgi:hypothetical protein